MASDTRAGPVPVDADPVADVLAESEPPVTDPPPPAEPEPAPPPPVVGPSLGRRPGRPPINGRRRDELGNS
ncbi:MAG TPA: hypothetical protein VGI68_15535 [Mycobacterium sp.]